MRLWLWRPARRPQPGQLTLLERYMPATTPQAHICPPAGCFLFVCSTGLFGTGWQASTLV